MPRRKIKLTPHEKREARAVLREFRRDQKEIKAAHEKPAFRITKDESLKGPGANLLRAVVGRRAYDSAVEHLGGAIVRRAALALDKARADSAKRKNGVILRTKAALKERGWSDGEIERYRRVNGFRGVRKSNVRVAPMRRGAYKYQRERRVNGRWVFDGARYRTESQANRGKLAIQKLKARAAIADILGVSVTRVGKIIRDVEKNAARDFREFKKSAAYKNRPARWRRGLTLKKFKAVSVVALYDLMEYDFISQ